MEPSQSAPIGGLAAALQAAKLRKVNKVGHLSRIL